MQLVPNEWHKLDEDQCMDLTGAGGPVALPTPYGTFVEQVELGPYLVARSDEGWLVIGIEAGIGEEHAAVMLVPPVTGG